MPKKHAVSFKHLIATSSRDQDQSFEQHHRTYPNHPNHSVPVQELLDRSRSARPIRPALVDDVGGQGVTWIPRPAGRLDLELEEGPTELHPAEQLRRARLAQRQAQRSVAGPAPPPSWRSSRPPHQPSSTSTLSPTLNVSEHDLHESSRLFSESSGGRIPPPRSRGTAKLIEHCFSALIRYLHSEVVVWSDPGGGGVVTLAQAMREGLPYLDTHLKAGLLAFNSSRPSDEGRLSDRSIRALLHPPLAEDRAPDEEEDDEWDNPSVPTLDRTTLIHHLARTSHPTPHTFLRNITHLPLLALTSLNLAYSVIPKETERLVNALPVGLRELGLVGIRCEADEKEWARFLSMLGKKLIVLRMLDISSPPHPIDSVALRSLLQPPTRQVPSLRLLGLRETARPHIGTHSGGTDDAEKNGSSSHMTSHQVLTRRKELVRTIRKDRSNFIEIIWE